MDNEYRPVQYLTATTILPYLCVRAWVQHKKSPITGEAMTAKDIIRLNMHKNSEGKWHCPVTFKVRFVRRYRRYDAMCVSVCLNRPPDRAAD